MVAAGDDVHAGVENFPCSLGRDAGTAGRIFAVGDDEIERVLFAEFGQEFRNRAPSGLADDVTNEEQFHGLSLITKHTKNTKRNSHEEREAKQHKPPACCC